MGDHDDDPRAAGRRDDARSEPRTAPFATVLAASALALALAAHARADEVTFTPLQTGAEGDLPRDLVVVGDLLFFSAEDGAGGRRLFVSDGTSAGTRGLGPSGAPASLVRHAGALWFSLDDGVVGRELWRSDGTEQGTTRVLDLDPGAASSTPRNLVSVRGVLAFDANDALRGRELWTTDGSVSGTRCVTDPDGVPGSSVAGVLGASRAAVWYATPSGQAASRIGASDLTPEGTPATVGVPGRLPIVLRSVVADGALFAVTFDTVDGRTSPLYRIDADGSEPGYLAQTAMDLVNVAGRLFVARHTPRVLSSQTPLGPTDGVELCTLSASGTSLERILDRGDQTLIANPGALGAVRRTLYFALTTADDGREPWISDGTAEGTRPVADVRAGATGSFPTGFRPLGSGARAVFTADDGVHGREPWITDGTAEGTRLLADLRVGSDTSAPTSLVVAGNALYVVADSGNGARVLAAPLRALDVDRTLRDLDGDGFPDELERFAGSDEADIASTPDDAAAATDAAALELTRVDVRLRFDRAARDRVRIAGKLSFSSEQSLDGARVLVDVGGLFARFDLDARGRATDAAGNRLRVRAPRHRGRNADPGRVRVTLRFARGDHAAALADEGLVPEPAGDTSLGAFLVLADRTHETRAPLRWRVRGAAGSARLAR